MRILHFSDLHLGIESYGRIDPARGLSTRLLDALDALDALVQRAIEEGVDAVIFAGDAYKNREPTPTHQRELAKRIVQLTQKGIAVVLVPGNHDLPNALPRATAVEIFDTLAVERVTVAQRPGVYGVETRSGVLQVATLPWPRRGDLLAQEEARQLSPTQIVELLQQMLAARVREMAQGLQPDVPGLLAGHVTLSTGKAGSESFLMLRGADPLLMPSQLPMEYDYVALGHLHRHQTIAHHAGTGLEWAVYSGSLHRVDFGEEDEEKGFCLIELDPRRPQGERLVGFRFVPVPCRRFVTLRYPVPKDEMNVTEAVLRYLERDRRRWEEAIVRVTVSLTQEQEPGFQERAIRRYLEGDGQRKGAHYVAAITREVERREHIRLRGSDEGWTPEEALRAYLEHVSVAEARKAELLEYGRRLIEEVSVPGAPEAGAATP